MCGTCGCSDGNVVTVRGAEGEHTHVMADGTVVTHQHDHQHDHQQAGTVETLAKRVLEKNDLLAERNRGWFAGRGVLALNVMSSPGSGKTTLLEHTVRALSVDTAVIGGDQATDRDAQRLRATNTPVVQINAGVGCHLEADMVWSGLQKLDPPSSCVVFIENVGNLVCPALFDLGEAARVVLFSVTEGEDKPLKYPHMFRTADLVLLTKTDLLPHLDFDLEAAEHSIATIAPDATIVRVSARSGDGLSSWYDWIESQRGPQRAETTRLRP